MTFRKEARPLPLGALVEEQYRHVAPHEHPLLWASDAVAWCHSNGGDWIRRVDAIVESRVTRL
ncbi:hypothetical protein [Microbacterium arborescens]|uniref:hypothetical protein n=1 Tax=Microbacterium arborescens TaxID=33883 RepID=UPI003C788C1C